MKTTERELIDLIEKYLIGIVSDEVSLSESSYRGRLLMSTLLKKPSESKLQIKEIFSDLRDYWDTLEGGR